MKMAEEQEWSDEHYHYRIIAPPQIIQNSRGPLNLDGPTPNKGNAVDRRISNQRTLEAYATEQGLKGWELITQVLYDGLPYGGGLFFRKKISSLRKDTVVSEVVADFQENTLSNLYAIFEGKTGKNAVWQGKETKNFLNWKEKYEGEQ